MATTRFEMTTTMGGTLAVHNPGSIRSTAQQSNHFKRCAPCLVKHLHQAAEARAAAKGQVRAIDRVYTAVLARARPEQLTHTRLESKQKSLFFYSYVTRTATARCEMDSHELGYSISARQFRACKVRYGVRAVRGSYGGGRGVFVVSGQQR